MKKITFCDDETANEVWDAVRRKYGTSETNPFILTPIELAEAARNNQIAQDWYNKPKCPICNSTNLAKITATKKIAKMAAFGIFGMGDNGMTWKCKNCGSKF